MRILLLIGILSVCLRLSMVGAIDILSTVKGIKEVEKLYSMYKKYSMVEEAPPDTHKVATDIKNNLDYRLPDIHEETMLNRYKQVLFC